MTVSGKRPRVRFPHAFEIVEVGPVAREPRALTIRVSGRLPDGFKQEVEAAKRGELVTGLYNRAGIDIVPIDLPAGASEEQIAEAELIDGAARIISEIVRLVQQYCESREEDEREDIRLMLSATSQRLGMRELMGCIERLKTIPASWFRSGVAGLIKEGRKIYRRRRSQLGENAATEAAMRGVEWLIHDLLNDWELRGGNVNWDLVHYLSSWQKLFTRKAKPGERVAERIASELLCIERDREDC